MDKVENLKSKKDHIEFFKEIKMRDQSFRGNHATLENDLKNLILVSHYYNLYGYPKLEVQSGNEIVGYVWIHNWIDKIGTVTFPLIIDGLKKGNIPMESYRNYYLRALYKHKYDDNRFGTLSTKQITELLDIPKEEKIDIEKILAIYNEYQKLLKSFDHTLGVWSTKERTRKIPFGDSFIEDVIESESIEIKEANGEYYFRKYSENWQEDTFKKLYKVDDKLMIFKMNYSDSYLYEICSNQELHMNRIDGSIFKKYFPHN